MIVNWPQGVFRDGDEGVSGLSAEDADKLHGALFVGEGRIRFVPRGEGKFLSTRCATVGGLCLISPPGSAYNDDRITPLAGASGADGPRESNRWTVGKQGKFIVTTQESYNAERPHKRRRA